MSARPSRIGAWPLAIIVVIGVGSCTIAFDLSSMQEGCPPGTKLCDNGQCVPNDETLTGCANPTNCDPCAYARGKVICNDAGACEGAGCLDPWADCNHDVKDGCETNIKTNAAHCLSCNQPACDGGLPNVQETACRGDQDAASTCGIAQCVPGFGDCNRDPKDGCEVDLSSDSANCGECDAGCGDAGACVQGHCPSDGGEVTPDAA
jgi:hypothetical protein